MAARIEYKIIGRYANGREITGYHIQGSNGASKKMTREQIAFLVGKGQIVNCAAQIYQDKLLLRGVGVALDSLPVKQDPTVTKSKDSIKAETRDNNFQSAHTSQVTPTPAVHKVANTQGVSSNQDEARVNPGVTKPEAVVPEVIDNAVQSFFEISKKYIRISLRDHPGTINNPKISYSKAKASNLDYKFKPIARVSFDCSNDFNGKFKGYLELMAMRSASLERYSLNVYGYVTIPNSTDVKRVADTTFHIGKEAWLNSERIEALMWDFQKNLELIYEQYPSVACKAWKDKRSECMSALNKYAPQIEEFKQAFNSVVNNTKQSMPNCFQNIRWKKLGVKEMSERELCRVVFDSTSYFRDEPKRTFGGTARLEFNSKGEVTVIVQGSLRPYSDIPDRRYYGFDYDIEPNPTVTRELTSKLNEYIQDVAKEYARWDSFNC